MVTPAPPSGGTHEDAAIVVAEYFSSLDNVPAEVAFLLTEIGVRDDTITTKQESIAKLTSSLYRSALNNSGSKPALTPSGPKDKQIHDKVQQEYGKIEALQEEKTALARKLANLVRRHRERGRDEWRRVVGQEVVGAHDAAICESLDALSDAPGAKKLVSEPSAEVSQSELLVVSQAASMLASGSSSNNVVGTLLAKSGLTTPVATPDDRSIKKRKGNNNPATSSAYFDMPPPPVPTPPAAGATGAMVASSASRKKRKTNAAATATRESTEEVESMNADEPEVEEGSDEVYCICREKSYGEMIGCDNNDCRYEWVSPRHALQAIEAVLTRCALAVSSQMRQHGTTVTGNVVLS